MSDPLVCFTVQGKPICKQSFRYRRNGRSFQPARVKAWQSEVGWAAKLAWQGKDPLDVPLDVRLSFRLPDHRRRDADNLSKGCLDSCNGILWDDDKQIQHLDVEKRIVPDNPGVDVCVFPYQETK